MDRFPYKTEPFADYQRDFLRLSWRRPFARITMEQGTGKTWLMINTAVALYLKKKIDGMVVLAPNGVHLAWALEQLPLHMSDAVPWKAYVWVSASERSTASPWLDITRDPSVGLAIFCVNTEALARPKCRKAIGTFLTNRRCLMVVDEAGDFVTPSAKRTQALMRYRERAPYRRTLDGTPVGTKPFEVYSPCRFLSPSILGYRTFAEMKEAHAEWDVMERGDNGREFKVIRTDATGKKIWKDLDLLRAKLKPHTFRITKADALPFLPPKQYFTRYFEMTPEQWRLTRALRDEMTAELANGGTITATNVLTRYLRYQQIACGYVPPDIIYGEETEPMRILPGPNPRLDMAVDEVLRYNGKPTIVWTRFQFDIDLLLPRLRAEGLRVVVYDGRTNSVQREEAVRFFQNGDINVFLSNPAAGGRGLNLFAAQNELFYANYFGLRRRLQAEDRGHRIGTAYPVNITDLVGLGSIDLKILKALRENRELADIVNDDPRKEWI